MGKSVTGNQWYWIYGCVSGTNFFNKNWSSAMLRGTLTARDSWNTRRYKKLQWAISSHDVIHNWGIAGSARDTLGVKIDAYPGGVMCRVPLLCTTVGCIPGIVQSCVGSTTR